MTKKTTKKGEVKEVIALKDMTIAELSSKSKQTAAEINKKRLDKSVGRLKNTREIFNLRKELARIKTLISVKS